MAEIPSMQNHALDKIIFIEGLRGIVALYVALHHFVHLVLVKTYPIMGKFFIFGQSAVILFFVMSGFVIYYSSFGHYQNLNFRVYFIRRFRRIYPLFLLALLVTYLVECLLAGTFYQPSYYELFGNLLMLQDHSKLGNWFSPFMDNSPLWSLSYEWFFYMLFFPTYLLFKKKTFLQKYAVLILSLTGYAIYWFYPNQISLFLMYYILWWSGVELAKEYLATNQLTWKKQSFSIIAIGILSLCWILIWSQSSFMMISSSQHPVLETRHFMSTFFIFIIGMGWYKAKGIGLLTIIRLGGYFAPISYGIYIFHMPIIDLCRDSAFELVI